MNILYVSNVEPCLNSGAAGTDLQNVNAFRNLGHSVETIWQSDLSHKLTHRTLHSLLELPKAMASSIERKLSSFNFDVIIANQPFSYRAARANTRRKNPVLFITRSHGFEARAQEVLSHWSKKLGIHPSRPRWKVLSTSLLDMGVRRACLLASRYTDGFLVSSNDDRDYLLQKYMLSEMQVKCVFQAAPQIYLETPNEEFTIERSRRMLFVGPPQLWKGTQILAKVVTRILHEHEETKFTWVCQREYHSYVRTLFPNSVLSQIEFLPYMNQEELIETYNSSGLLLFPSLFEGFGKVPLEAMTRGLCVVASSVGGMKSVIRHGENGLLVNPGDAAGLHFAVNNLLANFRTMKRISNLARLQSREFTWERMAASEIEWFRSLVEWKNTIDHVKFASDSKKQAHH